MQNETVLSNFGLMNTVTFRVPPLHRLEGRQVVHRSQGECKVPFSLSLILLVGRHIIKGGACNNHWDSTHEVEKASSLASPLSESNEQTDESHKHLKSCIKFN